MKPNRILYGVLGALALVSAPIARAQEVATTAKEPVTLVYKHKAGDVYRHKTTINASIAGMEAVLNILTKTTVKEVKPNGDIVLVEAGEGGTLNLGGMENELPATPAITTTRSKTGKVVDIKKEDNPMAFMSPEVEKLSALVGEILFTEKALKAGDTWQTELDNPVVKEKKVVVKGTYVGIEKVDGMDLWKVKQVAEAVTEAGGTKTTLTMTSWLNPANGAVVKMEGEVKDIPTLQAGVISWTMKMVLLKGDAKKSD